MDAELFKILGDRGLHKFGLLGGPKYFETGLTVEAPTSQIAPTFLRWLGLDCQNTFSKANIHGCIDVTTHRIGVVVVSTTVGA